MVDAPPPAFIDAHHHLWRYEPADFGWIGDEMPVLKRDFLPPELTSTIAAAGVVGTVAVQARQSLDETDFLLACAAKEASILGVVGWIPLAHPELKASLAELRKYPALKGVRHVVQDEPNDDFINGKAFNDGVARLQTTGLAYDILIHERHLPQAVLFARRHPLQRMVLDHLAKPNIAAAGLEPWRSNLMRLADCPNVMCKLSGLVTEADWSKWTLDELRPYLDVALEAFGPQRLMVGSDWPVCLLASSYQRWWETLDHWAANLPLAERQAIFAGTAKTFYNLSP